jgi:hypothetical protein
VKEALELHGRSTTQVHRALVGENLSVERWLLSCDWSRTVGFAERHLARMDCRGRRRAEGLNDAVQRSDIWPRYSAEWASEGRRYKSRHLARASLGEGQLDFVGTAAGGTAIGYQRPDGREASPSASARLICQR